MVFSVLKRATGVDLLEDLSRLLPRASASMAEGFRERAEQVNALLADSRSAFVLVTSPRADAVEEAAFFHHRLLDAGLPFGGVIANRVRAAAPEGQPGRRAGGAARDEALARKVMRTFEEERRLAARDRATWPTSRSASAASR